MDSIPRRPIRVVVTGLGVVSPVGSSVPKFWEAITLGKSGVDKISSFDTGAFATHIGAEVKDLEPHRWLSPRQRGFGRASQFLLAGCLQALDDARLSLKELASERNVPICVGTTMGEIQALEEIDRIWLRDGDEAVPQDLISTYGIAPLANRLSSELGLTGQTLVLSTACSAGNYAIGYMFDLLQLRRAEVAIAGGVDPLSRIAFTGFNRLLSLSNDRCRPFDKNRSGTVLGEGCGVVVLETLERARRRGATIHAEILGYGLSCDAKSMTSPDASGIALAMISALADAGVKGSAVDYVCAHGTGTIANDKAEASAVCRVLGKEGHTAVPMSSIKSMLGHTMGAASAIESIACILSIRSSLLPPTINYETPDEDCRVDCVPNKAREKDVRIVLNNASAFGGNNACLVLKRFEE